MHIKEEKKTQKIEKMLERKEARALTLTEDGNLSVRRKDFEFQSDLFLVITPRRYFARVDGAYMTTGDAPLPEKAIPLAVYTPTRALILDAELQSYINGEASLEADERFAAFFATTEFLELFVVNGKYGNQVLHRMFSTELTEIALQYARMLLISCQPVAEGEKLDAWFAAQIKLLERG